MSTCFCYRNIIRRSLTSSCRWISSESMDRRWLPVPSANIKSLLLRGGSSKCRRSFHQPTTTLIWNASSDTTTEKVNKPTLEDATTTSTTTSNNSNNNSNKKNMLFPWQPLPRNRQAEPNEHSAFNFWMDIFSGTNFIEGLSRRQGVVEKSAFVRIEKNLRALFFLNISMTQSLFETGWISDLVDSSAWAFAHAVGTVLSNMSHDVPLDQIIKTDGDSVMVDFDGKVFRYVPKEMSPAIHNMLEKRLITTYYKASAPPIPLQSNATTEETEEHQRESQPFHVKLKMKVLGGKLVGFDMIEFVTRAMAEEDPTQKTFLKEAHQAYQSSVLAYYRTLEDLGLQQMQLRGASSVSFTIIMEVMVDCEEEFTVTDSNGTVVQGAAAASTGNTLEGDEEATTAFKPTSHLVRLENVVDFDVVQRTFQLGSWTITDWDDLLEGNVWLEG